MNYALEDWRSEKLWATLVAATTLAAAASAPIAVAQPSGSDAERRAVSQQTRFELRPHLAADAGTWTPGLRYDVLYRRDQAGRATAWFAEVASTGYLLGVPGLNTEPLLVDLAAGFVKNFVQIDDNNLLPITTDPDTVDRQPLRDYGRLDAGVALGFETNQTFDDQQVTAGVEAGYVNIRTVGWWGWVPSLVVSARGVLPVTSAARDALEAETDPFVSVRGTATLAPRIGTLLPGQILQPLGLHVQATGHWEMGTGATWRDANRHRAGLIAGTLLYAVNQRIRFIDQVYARFSRGRVPPYVVSGSTWTIGLVLYAGS
jgi:hypothetical protein